jgi:carboxypeptidase Taq
MTIKKLDELFDKIKEFLIPFIEKIKKKDLKIENGFLKGEFPIEEQKKYNSNISKEIGFSFDDGMLGESTHPFTSGLNRNDVRITTRYRKDEFLMSIVGNIF